MRRALILGALVMGTSMAAHAQSAQSSPVDARLRAEIALLSRVLRSIAVPPADSFQLGNYELPAGTTRSGTVAAARGNLIVRGRIEGDALALHGDIIVYPGGSVTGQAVAVDGRVQAAGGVIQGDIRS